MECEVCGFDSNELLEVIFEGQRVYACKKCIRQYNLTVVRKKSLVSKKYLRRVHSYKKDRITLSGDYDLIPNYGNIIKSAREKVGYTQEELARKIGVKLSYMKKVEQGRLFPELSIARKLEKLLGVKLVLQSEEVGEFKEMKEVIEHQGQEDFTIGDLLRGHEDK